VQLFDILNNRQLWPILKNQNQKNTGSIFSEKIRIGEPPATGISKISKELTVFMRDPQQTLNPKP
jgi:hypothetical protein